MGTHCNDGNNGEWKYYLIETVSRRRSKDRVKQEQKGRDDIKEEIFRQGIISQMHNFNIFMLKGR